ncbi:MAG: hypothetical protein IPH35_22125 [Rhodoferax sp.]|nr:hypothetical protein [Rhodoferax sp.]
MYPLLCALLALLCASAAHAQETNTNPALSGKLSAQWDERSASSLGPLAQANSVQSGTVPPPASGATLQAELRARARNWNAIATVQQQSSRGQEAQNQSWVNELVATHDAGSWQYSAGKKIVGWDVGYAFRPNDVVQQEARRTLVSTTAEGRPVAMAEYFDAESAWSLVLVNPTSDTSRLGATEPAFAARFYQRQGALDWHGFARTAQRTGTSLGGALSWVADDSLELHASARILQHADSLAMNPDVAPLSTSNPWQPSLLGHTQQALIGGTWTHTSQLSILLEAWWDGTALSPQQWQQWRERNQSLATLSTLSTLTTLAGFGVPASAVAGNLAWQSDAFAASPSLHRSNLYTRISWEHDAWQPSLDLLYHPSDGGLMATAALLWKGDRVQVQGGIRIHTGPDDSVVAQLPTQRQAYVQANWAF